MTDRRPQPDQSPPEGPADGYTGLDNGDTPESAGYPTHGQGPDPGGDDTDEDGERIDTSDIGYETPTGEKEPSA